MELIFALLQTIQIILLHFFKGFTKTLFAIFAYLGQGLLLPNVLPKMFSKK